VSTEWIVFVCSIKICGYYNKGVYVLIRSTTTGYFWGRWHGSAWKCIYPRNKYKKNTRNL